MPKKSIYKIVIENENKKIQIKRLLIMIIIIILLIGLILCINNIIKVIQAKKAYKQYENQLIAIQKEEQKKQAKIKEKQEKIRQAKMPKLTDIGKENIKNIYHSENKRVFLTFDDGPSSNTAPILDILKQEKVKATFFVLGSRVQAQPEVVKRIYDEGHYIANHGFTHSYSAIYSSPQAVVDEFNQCNDAVKNAIGVPEYNSHLFRFPGGFVGGPYAEIKNQAKELLNQNNIVNVDWNALTGDGETNKLSAEFEMGRLQQTVGEKNSVIVLMHDAQAKKVTAETLPQIIQFFRDRGYEFKNFYEIIK